MSRCQNSMLALEVAVASTYPIAASTHQETYGAGKLDNHAESDEVPPESHFRTPLGAGLLAG